MENKKDYTPNYLKKDYSLTLVILIFLVSLNGKVLGQSTSTVPNNKGKMWVTAYLASWNHFVKPGGNWGDLPTSGIEWNSFTQLIYFALAPKSNGQIDAVKKRKNVNPSRVHAIVAAAHKHGKPVLISIGGWGHYTKFSNAISTAQKRKLFINNLVELIKKWHFDGIDLDMEPIKNTDVSHYTLFVKQLYTALQKVKVPVGGKPMLTAVTRWQPEMFHDLSSYLDQINLMTYDLSGAWHGWVSWFNSAVFSGGQHFPHSDKPLPSVNQTVQKFLNSGLSPSKLGIGIDYYGYIWHGVSKPGQGWIFDAPKVKSNVPYNEIIKKYYSPNRYRWDKKSQASYLTINKNKKLFITYDSKQTIRAKFHYVNNKKLGGIFIWELGATYFKNNNLNNKYNLTHSVRQNIESYSNIN